MAETLDIENIKKTIKNSVYEVDYASKNKDGALFLPSISSLYVKHVSKKDNTIRNGDIPKGLKSIEDLNIIDPEKGLFWYPWVLYSAGHAQLDLDKSNIQESMIQKRNKNNTFVLADSGGYQLSTGVLKGYMGDLDNMNVDTKSLRHKILKWLEHTADFSMVLDIPTTSCKNTNSFIYKKYNYLGDKGMFYKCLEYTVKNNAYFIKHRIPQKTKFLNVLQGRDINEQGTGENDIWYDVVKHFNDKNKTLQDVKKEYNKKISSFNLTQPSNKQIGLFLIEEDDNIPFGDRAFEGWAIPGNLKFDFQMMMKRFKKMKEDGFLENTNENLLIHFLGISRISAGLLYTTIQQELRQKYNPNIIITYDAASPFVCTAKGKGYSSYTVNKTKMTYAMRTLPDKKYIKTINNKRIYISPEKDDNNKKIEITYDSKERWHRYHKTSKIIDVLDTESTFSLLFDNGEKYIEQEIIEDTTLGKKLTVGDICYKDGKTDDTKSFWDGTSYVYIMNMNMEQHIRAIQEAYKIYRLKDKDIKNRLPKNIFKGKNAIEQIIQSDFDNEIIKRYLPDLKNILGMSPQSPDGTLDNIMEDEGMENEGIEE